MKHDLRLDEDIATLSSIAAVRSSPGDEFLPVKGHRSLPSVAGLDPYIGCICELGHLLGFLAGIIIDVSGGFLLLSGSGRMESRNGRV